ncbi:hypothetical protein LZ32DRAFT_666540 [Colletotrichum eremochloae]|nr:hypothetical protein LZ32DRAFT_666540 [Colletotrichum eremochloae]
MIKSTKHDLNIYLQRINKKIAGHPQKITNDPDATIDWNHERAILKGCLHICEDANLPLLDRIHAYGDEMTRLQHKPDILKQPLDAYKVTSDEGVWENENIDREITVGIKSN